MKRPKAKLHFFFIRERSFLLVSCISISFEYEPGKGEGGEKDRERVEEEESRGEEKKKDSRGSRTSWDNKIINFSCDDDD